MTRINAGVAPSELHRRHLIAEYREITMVPAALRRSLRTRHQIDILKGIPKEFTLNKGHVSFFFDKQEFLRKRFRALCAEMTRRGYQYDPTREIPFIGFAPEFNNDWQETEQARILVLDRINLRKSEKPHLYT